MLKKLMFIWLMIFCVAASVAQEVYVIDQVSTGAVRTYRINGEQNSTYTWILTGPTGDTVQLANPAGTGFTAQDGSGNTIYGSELEIAWTGVTGTYQMKVIQRNGSSCETIELGVVEVSPMKRPEFSQIGPYCQASAAPPLPLVSNNGITGTWEPAIVNTAETGVFLYTFTPGSDQNSAPLSLSIVIVPMVVPQFSLSAELWQNSEPPILPTVSSDGIYGSWSPSVITTSESGNHEYLFTPMSGQCALPYTLSVTVKPLTIPTFEAFGPYCLNAKVPDLPAISMNNVPGTWSPDKISTAATGTFKYVFTPAEQDGYASLTMEIEIVPQIIPTFNPIGPLWQNTVAPTLPSVSTNNITGTWIPDVINTSITGTATFLFTPGEGQCGALTTMEIVINELGVPSFDPIGPFCIGSTPEALPSVSKNGFTGTWNPATISTSTIGSSEYTFTPSPNQGGLPLTIIIGIIPQVAPEFTQIGPLVQQFSAPVLPASSLNGISGSWDPSVISTAQAGTTIYTFTPDAGQCASVFRMSIVVEPAGIPEFNPIGPFCLNSVATELPAISKNGIAGSWSPSVVNTSSVGIFPYLFTPNPNQGSSPVTIQIEITTKVTPTFHPIGPFYQNSEPPILPSTSANGISGTWNPARINTSAIGTTTYAFTPDAGQCGNPTSINIEILALGSPVFDPIGPVCQNSTPLSLPVVSKNGIAGAWVPAMVYTSTVGKSVYLFTPDPGQNSNPYSMEIEVTAAVTPQFDAIGPLCRFSAAPVLPAVSKNGIRGTWSPATISTSFVGTTVYTFTPEADQCAKPGGISITINPATEAKISYPANPICKTSPDVVPTIEGTTGGRFTSSPVGLALDSISGRIDPKTSQAGTYTVTYTIPSNGVCGEFKTDATIAIGLETLITKSPEDQSVLYPENAWFKVQAVGENLTYRWQVNAGNGFTDIEDSDVYSGSSTDSLGLTAPPLSMRGYRYRAVVGGTCSAAVNSLEARLLVSATDVDLRITAIGLDKEYDGTDLALVTFTDDRLSGDSIVISYTTAAFETRNAGKGRQITIQGISVSGPDSKKYRYSTLATATADINPKKITVRASADFKEYDGTMISKGQPVIEPELAVGDRGTFSQTFEDRNTGSGKRINPSGAVEDGNSGLNYSISFIESYEGAITPKSIIGSFTASGKTYDGTVDATILTRSLNGLVEGDSVVYAGGIATFDTPDAGEDKLVTGREFLLDGPDKINYTVNDTATTTASIYVLGMGTLLDVNQKTFTRNEDLVTLTATIFGGAQLMNLTKSAQTAYFMVDGQMLRDENNNSQIPVMVSGPNLTATITVQLKETTIGESVEPGLKTAVAYFNDENTNIKLTPNPAKTSIEFIPGANISVFPNPSRGPVNFKISSETGGETTLELYTPGGELLKRIFEGKLMAGETRIIPYEGFLEQGTYRYQIRINKEVIVGNVIIIAVY